MFQLQLLRLNGNTTIRQGFRYGIGKTVLPGTVLTGL
jgi:hypothetical protein